jgi:hypothetical protein
MRLRLLVLLAVVCALTMAASASASSGAAVMHFAVTYPGGLATCHGDRITHMSGGKTFIKDVETCVVSAAFNPFAPGIYDATSQPVGPWCSDVDGAIFNLATCNPAISGHVTVSAASAKGTVIWHIVAYYAQP